jgi:hypothetical protein
MVQGHVGISPWEFESPLRHHRKKGHRKVAFLLDKFFLVPFGLGGWVRLGASGQVDPYRHWCALEASDKRKGCGGAFTYAVHIAKTREVHILARDV